MDGLRATSVRLSRIVFPGVLVTAYLFGFIQYRAIHAGLIDPYNSVVDTRLLLLLSVLVVPLLVRFSRRTLNLLFLTIQLVLLLFIITLTNNNLAITVILSSAFIFAAGYYLRRPVNVIFSIVAGISILAFQRSIPVENVLTPTINQHELTMLGFLFILLIVLSWMISSIIDSHESLNELITSQKDTIANLVETNVGIQKYALVKKDELESAERMRITRDIHDTVGYVLTNNITLLRACAYYVPKRLKKAHLFLDDALKNAQDGLTETRAVLKKLRDITRTDGAAEIGRIIRLFQESTGIEVAYNIGNTPGTWGRGLDYVFYRTIQEGLVNSAKHGKATRISISFWQTESEVVLTISDNGTGSHDEDARDGIGLQGMQERLARFNGVLDARRYDYGFNLCIRVPLGSIGEERE